MVGALLMLLNTPVDIAKGVLFFPILDRHGRRTALAYLAMMSVEAVLLCVRLLRGGLILRFVAWWGAVGYAILMSGNIAELFGLHVGVALSIPGGLFEVALGGLLIVRGLRDTGQDRRNSRVFTSSMSSSELSPQL